MKRSAGSLLLKDRSGRDVGKVGTGFSRDLRREIWSYPKEWIGRVIQVQTMGLAARKLRMPIFNGDADGEVDLVE